MSKLHSTDFAELTSEDYSDNMLYDEDAEYEEFDEMDDENEEDILDDNADEGFIDPFDD